MSLKTERDDNLHIGIDCPECGEETTFWFRTTIRCARTIADGRDACIHRPNGNGVLAAEIFFHD